jgi:ABC-type uncharacterized transport system auxiliary subunit
VSIAVAEPTALIAFDTQKLLLRSTSGARTQIAGNVQWADTLPKLIQTKVIQALENAMSPALVGRAADNLAADRQLLIDIRNFEVPASDQSSAIVELSAKIVGGGNRIVDARVFSATTPVPSTDALPAAASLDQAFGKVATDLAIWARRAH